MILPDDPQAGPEPNTIWALRNISFTVQQGEILGIIGRNGAGKSTLLKILSRITEPTEGKAIIRGRTSSLLEVGTGFHPELTGRENVYLNGAILGMRRSEIARKFDEIVAFSEIEKFIDTPVKRYSSGMYVRLAFAVAAHLEPEILLVDEVLAVGDAEFQKKCLGKMGDVAKEGRTVLFVSHNMQAVSQLCNRAILLQKGSIWLEGVPTNIINEYLNAGSVQSAEIMWPAESQPGSDVVNLLAMRVRNSRDEICYNFDLTESVMLEAEILCLKENSRLNFSYHVYNQQGICLFAVTNHHDLIWGNHNYEAGRYKVRCVIPENYLNEGKHFISLVITSKLNSSEFDVYEKEVISFQVFDSGTVRGGYFGGWLGVVRPLLQWNIERGGGLL